MFKFGLPLYNLKVTTGNIVPSHTGENNMAQSQISRRQERFLEATNYATFARNQPLYMNKSVGTPLSPYNWAVADYFGIPEVLEVDLSQWTRKAGQTLLIKAIDNMMVLSVRVQIFDDRDSENAFEEGEAVQSEMDALLWTYTVRNPLRRRAGTRLDVFAMDLPGNIGGYSLEIM
jgi:hypothetical protein